MEKMIWVFSFWIVAVFVFGEQCPADWGSQCLYDNSGNDKECGEDVLLPSGNSMGPDVNIIDNEQYPYIASLQTLKCTSNMQGTNCYEHFCGGTMIAPNLVLTSAHCLDKLKSPYPNQRLNKQQYYTPKESIYVSISPRCRHLMNNNYGRFEVNEIIIHPKYQYTVVPVNDVAILEILRQKGQFYLGPLVEIVGNDTKEDFEQAQVLGYGLAQPQHTGRYILYPFHGAKLNRQPLEVCKYFLDQYDNVSSNYLNYTNMMCYWSLNATSCDGDSGGPLLTDQGIQIGLASWSPARSCESTFGMQAPGVYVQLTMFANWIQKVMEDYIIDELDGIKLLPKMQDDAVDGDDWQESQIVIQQGDSQIVIQQGDPKLLQYLQEENYTIVIQQGDPKLLQYLQAENYTFEIVTNAEEKIENYISTCRRRKLNLKQMLSKQMCFQDFINFGRTSFNAVGTIRISLLDGTEKYCTGTLIGDSTVITSAECYQENAVGFQYQPSWVYDTVWLTLQAIYIPDKWIVYGTNSPAIFFLTNHLKDAPKIGFDIDVTQSQQCYITLLGWIFSASGIEYKMVTCPNLADVEEQLGIISNCGDKCNLDELDFQTGSPIILTCPNPTKPKHAVIGLLLQEESQCLSPYIFNLLDYQDIVDKVINFSP